MIDALLTAVAVMIFSSVATHLELMQEISVIFSKVLNCAKCLTFWLTLILLYMKKINIITAFTVAIVFSYLANWFGLILFWFGKKYNEIWEKLKSKKRVKK